jgi:hypothetical protein
MTLMRQNEYAKRRGVSAQYINRLVKQRKIVLVGKKINPRQADAAIRNSSTRPERSKLTARPKVKTPSRKAWPAKPKTKAPRTSATQTLTEAKASREGFQAKIAELDYQKQVGNLLPRDQVLEAERRKNVNIRTSFRRIARSLAPVLARTNSEAEAERLVLREVDRILGQLATDPLGAAADVPAMPPPAAAVPAEISL